MFASVFGGGNKKRCAGGMDFQNKLSEYADGFAYVCSLDERKSFLPLKWADAGNHPVYDFGMWKVCWKGRCVALSSRRFCAGNCARYGVVDAIDYLVGCLGRRVSICMERTKAKADSVCALLSGRVSMVHTLKENQKGMATLEMTILMPILIFIIGILLYMGFYVYNRTALYCDGFIAASKSVENPTLENPEALQIGTGQMGKQMQDQLIAMQNASYEVSISYAEVSVAYEGKMEVPFIGEGSMFSSQGVFSISGKVRSQRHTPVTFIRQCKKVEKLVDTIKDKE